MEQVVLLAHRIVSGDTLQMYELLFTVQGRPIYVNLYSYAVAEYAVIDGDNTALLHEAARYAVSTVNQANSNN